MLGQYYSGDYDAYPRDFGKRNGFLPQHGRPCRRNCRYQRGEYVGAGESSVFDRLFSVYEGVYDAAYIHQTRPYQALENNVAYRPTTTGTILVGL